MTDKKPKNPGETRWIERGIFARKTRTGEVRYGISYMHRGRRRMEMVGPTKTFARKALEIRHAEIVQGRFKIPTRKRAPTFDTFSNTYLEDYAKPKKRSWRRDAGALKKAREYFKGKALDQITSWDIERYRAQRVGGGVTKATANRDLALLRHMLNKAVEWGHISENPAQTVKAYREEEKDPRVLTPDEERSLINAAAPHLGPLLTFGLNTGMRRREMLDLRWDAVNLVRRQVTVKHSKSGRVRHIPLNDAAIGALRLLPRPHSGHVFKYDGKPVNNVRTGFEGAVRRSGIARCTLHDLRHTFASRLVMGGVDLPTVKELLGHSSIQTTMRYSHPTPEHRREAVNKLPVVMHNEESESAR